MGTTIVGWIRRLSTFHLHIAYVIVIFGYFLDNFVEATFFGERKKSSARYLCEFQQALIEKVERRIENGK